MLNKSFVTTAIALVVTIIGYLYEDYSDFLITVGLFALSGSLTNWLAIHMLFEKVPLLYGSGVIPNQFEKFKTGIKQLLLSEFFTRDIIESLISQQSDSFSINIEDRIDFNRVFNGLVEAIEGSPMGGMIGMFGGRKALEPLREPLTQKLREIIMEVLENEKKNNNDGDISIKLIQQIEQIIDQRLQQLTPVQVKEIVQNIIREHLGWLVIWGGAFGGFMGCLVALA